MSNKILLNESRVVFLSKHVRSLLRNFQYFQSQVGTIKQAAELGSCKLVKYKVRGQTSAAEVANILPLGNQCVYS